MAPHWIVLASPESDLEFYRYLGIAIVIAVVGAVVLIVRMALRKPQTKFRHIYSGLEVRDKQWPGDVSFRFHTYDGLLIWVTQTTHQGFAAPADARELLRRLHRYNWTHGLLSAGVIFVPFLTYFNYRAQMKSIAAQEATDITVTPANPE